MTARERVIRMFGCWEKVPGYLRRALGLRDKARERREREAREAKERQEAEWARIEALRRPPRNVRLERVGTHGARIVWEPPETADELPPDGYWISEFHNGAWTAHGDYLLPDKRKSALYGQGPARVETWYHQMKLEERYPSAAVELPAPEETEPPPAPSRIERIASAVRSYTGRRTRDRRPWLRYLRAHAGIPDITSSERDEAHRIAGERT